MAFSTHDQVPDSPTNVFATAVPAANITLSDGNLKCAATQEVWDGITSSISVKSGKYYYEYLVVHSGNLNRMMMGLANLTAEYTKHFDGKGVSGDPASVISDNPLWVKMTWTNYHANTTTYTGDSTAVANDDILGIFFDLDSSTPTIKYYHNGTLKQSFDLVADKFYTPIALLNQNSSSSNAVIFNFGQDSSFGGNKTSGSANTTDANGIGDFYYDPTAIDSDALALCTANLPDPAIDPNVDDLPEDNFKCTLYSGSTSAALDHDTGLKADLVWVKKRNNTERHLLVDSVRGGNSTSNFVLYPNLTTAQEYDNVNNNNWGTLTTSSTANSRFQVDANQGYANDAHNFVCWAWKAGGSPTADNTATSGAMTANSVSVDGALQSSYTPSGSPTIYPTRMSVNTKAGFSIIKYGGNTASSSTVPHGLGKAPEMIIIKNLDSSDQWVVYHKSVASDAETDYLVLNTTAAAVDNAAVWNDTAPTTQVFSIGHGGSISELNENFIAYCWHSIEGYSAFGSYTGNGSTNGPFIYTGFKPAWLMIKNSSDSNSWMILDNQRSPHNLSHQAIRADSAGIEITNQETNYGTDLLSNGFKPRTSGGATTNSNNASNDIYIYACFSEMPFKYAATNAR